MQFILLALFSLGIVAVDQLTKYLTVSSIPLYGEIPFIPGFMKFTYVQNTGAAFSALEGMQWLFVVIFLVLTVLVPLEYFKFRLPFTNFERWLIAAVYGGGLGNMIDRVRCGYVIDMLETEFIVFPVFNVADCFITCGCIALMIRLVFFNKDFWKDGKV